MTPEPLEPEISSLKWNRPPGVPTVPRDTTCGIEDGSKECTPAPCVGVACSPAPLAIERLPLPLSAFRAAKSSTTFGLVSIS